MKQLRFLQTVFNGGILMWKKGKTYDVKSEGTNSQGRSMYKLLCEDSQIRGIDTKLKNVFFEVIDIKSPKIEEIVIEKKQEEKKTTKKKTKKK